MPNEEIYDYIAEEVEDIKKGLRKRHRTGVAGAASAEMVNLRDKTDELSMVLADEDEEKRRRKLKEAYKASLNYEMHKREDTVDYA